MDDDERTDSSGLLIEPLDTDRHDRAGFSCGVARLDNFLKRTARKHQTADFTRVWVATPADRPSIAGYYALNAHSLEIQDLPQTLARGAPRSGAIPAIYLSMIAVDLRQQGRGVGRFLLVDALLRAESAARDVGLKAVILDVIDDGGSEAAKRRQSFYAAMGFKPFPSRHSRMFIPIATVRAALMEE